MSEKVNLFIQQQKLKQQVVEIWEDAIVEILSNNNSINGKAYILRITRYRNLKFEIELTEQELQDEHNLILTSVIPRLHTAWDRVFNLQKELDWIKSMKERSDDIKEKEHNESQNMVSTRQNYLNFLPSIDRGLIEITELLNALKKPEGLEKIQIEVNELIACTKDFHTQQKSQFDKSEERLTKMLVELQHIRLEINEGLRRISNYILLATAVIAACLVFLN